MQSKTMPVEAQDEALDTFRRLFPDPCSQVTVWDDGICMKMQVKDDKLAARWLLSAQTIIAANQLPLEAEIDEFSERGVIFDRWLLIKYIPCV